MWSDPADSQERGRTLPAWFERRSAGNAHRSSGIRPPVLTLAKTHAFIESARTASRVVSRALHVKEAPGEKRQSAAGCQQSLSAVLQCGVSECTLILRNAAQLQSNAIVRTDPGGQRV